MEQPPTWTAFAGLHRLASGGPAEVAVAALAAGAGVLVFDDRTGGVVDLRLRGTAEEVAARYRPAEAPRGRGRPKLGVTAREVTLLPRHWDWLAAQPGGASVALRKLVEAAARSDDAGARRLRQERAYRLLTALAGDLPGYEAALRALFADDPVAFADLTSGWPGDVAAHAARFAWP